MAIFALTASARPMLLALGGAGRSVAGTDFLISVAALAPVQLGMPVGPPAAPPHPAGAVSASLVLVVLAAGGIDLLRRALL